MNDSPEGDYLGIPGARKHIVETSVSRSAFIKAGSGPPLLLLHGLGTSCETWYRTIGPLSERHTVFAPDLAGHGESGGPKLRRSVEPIVEALDAMCAHEGIDSGAIVGHSLGGLVAIRFALAHPERVTHLVLVDAGGIGPELSWLLRLAAIPLMGRLVFGPARLFVRHAGKRAIEPPGRVDTNLLKAMHRSKPLHVTSHVVRGAVRSGAERLGPVDDAFLLPRLGEIPAPVLVLWGEQDRLFPAEQLEGVREACPLVKIKTFPDVGHWPYAEVPDEFNAAVLDFLRDSGGAPHAISSTTS